MPGERALELGNLICRFGSDVLLDKLDDIVLPAFKDKALSRSYGNSEYFFLDVKVVELGRIGNEVYKGVAGRIVKNTKLIREQIYRRDSGLTRNRKALRSAPSSIFVLILNQHRLLFLREMTDAPSMSEFRSTLLKFITLKYWDLINEKYLAVKERQRGGPWDEKTKKRDFIAGYPRPSLKIIPLSSDDSINEFIDRYEIIKYVEFLFKDRNDELDDSSFYETLQKKQNELGDAKLRFADKAGLPKEKIKSEVQAATESGNQRVVISGTDQGGDKLVGSNEDFKVRKPIEKFVGSISALAKSMFSGFKELVDDGVVKNPVTPPNKSTILKNIRTDE